jgi:hypothetical protein
MRNRLGPKVQEDDPDDNPVRKGGMMSRVVVDQKSRDEALAEKKAHENTDVTKVTS